MSVTKTRIENNLATIRGNILEACERSNRSEDAVSIVAVTKNVDMTTVKNLLDTGLVDLGENRVRQLTERTELISGHLSRRRNKLPCPIKWHMIGHLQRNKVKKVLMAVGDCGVVQSVDSLRLAEEIDDSSRQLKKITKVMLQVNCSQEKQKSGCAVGAAVHLAQIIDSMDNLSLVGLMTMAAVGNAPAARMTFSRLRELFEEMEAEKIGKGQLKHLSMGMSQDYIIAVEEGSTMVRIGSALFK